MKNLLLVSIAIAVVFALPKSLWAFCGFYVAKADASLFNEASEVILVRDGNRTTLTMSNDFSGNVNDFAMVVPVPVVLQEADIRVVERSIFDNIDAYSAPRLVEYYDTDPCQPVHAYKERSSAPKAAPVMESKSRAETTDADYGVTIEAKYAVGEYDILILSATESVGLKRWLLDNGYKIPATAHEVLDPYIKSNLKFFVVKVNVDLQQESQLLRPIQITYESPKFMLPIRLGMANSRGNQDLLVYAFSRKGRIECTNYRTINAPTGKKIPEFVKDNFGKFYVDVFRKSWLYHGKNAVFLEYAWDVTPQNTGMKCDPCVAPPPYYNDMQQAGVSWQQQANRGGYDPSQRVFFTRLHVRYGRSYFAQDLQFQETPNTENFQARYIITHPARSTFSCPEAQTYLQSLVKRRQEELTQLRQLAGWDVSNRQDYVTAYSSLLKKNKSQKQDAPFGFFFDDDDSGSHPPFAPIGILVGGIAVLLAIIILYTQKSQQKTLNQSTVTS
jgi:hypothetical protein